MITECKACDGTGWVCADCNQSESLCECDSDLDLKLRSCDNCEGTGEERQEVKHAG